MSTVVVVKKAGVAVIAADTMTRYGSLCESADYIVSSTKMVKFGKNHFAHVGHASFGLVWQSYFRSMKTQPKLTSVQDVFEMARQFHVALKDDYFLNSIEDEDDPFESMQHECLIANPYGIFGLYALRSVQEYKRFYAFGSGKEYAFGAMHAVYDSDLSAEEIARKGIEAAATFDDGTGLPLELVVVPLKQTKPHNKSGQRK